MSGRDNSVTSGDANMTRVACHPGESDTPARARSPFGGRLARVGVVALLALTIIACDDAEQRRTPAEPTPPVDRSAADPAEGIATELDGASPAFGDAVLAELTGDEAAARAGFERVLAAADTPSPLAARAALHLAQIELRSGRTGHARDLALRAAALAPNDPVIYEGGAQIRASAVAESASGDIRGPRIGTPLPGVSTEVAEAFATAEKAFARVHRLRPRPIIEALSTSIRAKEDATEAVVAQYRAVAEHGGVAFVAGHYRAGSLYHDLALGLLFELPPELDPNVAAGLRRTLRRRALLYLERAAAEYRLALARPGSAGPRSADEIGAKVDAVPLKEAELWRIAAETDLRAALDLLGEK